MQWFWYWPRPLRMQEQIDYCVILPFGLEGLERARIHQAKSEAMTSQTPGWKQPRCASTGQWMNALRYIPTTGEDPARRANEPTWLTFRCALLSERRTPKATYGTIALIYSEKETTAGTETASVIARGWGGTRLATEGLQKRICCWMNLLDLICSTKYTTL